MESKIYRYVPMKLYAKLSARVITCECWSYHMVNVVKLLAFDEKCNKAM